MHPGWSKPTLYGSQHAPRQRQGLWGPPPDEPLPFAGRLGPYQLLEWVGGGTWSDVFRAMHLQRGKLYALKLLREGRRGPEDTASGPATRRRDHGLALLMQEREVAQRVRHPNLVALAEAYLDAPPYYLVLDWVAGQRLSRHLAERKKLVVPKALWIARQVAEALEALHQAGFLHGDVKAANVLVAPNGMATLVDLGLARSTSRASGARGGVNRSPDDTKGSGPALRLLRSGQASDGGVLSARAAFLAGTAHYMAPELTLAGGVGDIRSDLYSLGVTLYEMLTGYCPFPDGSLATTLRMHREALPPSPRLQARHLSPPITKLLHRLLAKDPLRRHQTPRELVDALTRLEIETLDYPLPA